MTKDDIILNSVLDNCEHSLMQYIYAVIIITRIAASAPAASSAPEAVKVEEKPKAEEVDALDGGTYSNLPTHRSYHHHQYLRTIPT